MKKHILLVGGYNKTISMSQSLLKKGYEVTVINSNYDHCQKMAEIPKLNVIFGDGTKPFVLQEAQIQTVDIAIALTQKDETNLVICELCKKKFEVYKTVSLIDDPKKIKFFYAMGVDSVVSAINAITNIVEQQALIDEITTVIPVGEGRITIAEVKIPMKAKTVGKKLWEIDLPKEVIIGCILRDEESMVPRGDTRIQAGDELILISSDKKEKAIKELTGEI
ncbi:potassium channel family protein [Marinilactibacillus psychrotolerans]|uniref:TRK system potassium uptake protein TrkA n=1 Tax=Marinilactibacillus psychrotolerans TaxID=191770 RepID=A0AAV3WR32_9LACT|nr:NAD-binding protein [Marinilactibacillus psychrotolerans]GEL66756.1 TRK system potassium uptake protein TrkA [Marinilactibacillus psychrotolerans]GEQ35797.1 TRK system potassium uptake protein TrkA [Marinilactibacillus psychrotolerans]SDC33018.1 trk system potassium uptake protein TrkA [Marinilactibacillus psychrotolerans]